MFRVVIADDERKVLQLMKKLIDWEGAGFEIVGTAGDGLSALELVEELQPDLLITDIRMPLLNGIELLKKTREKKPDLLCVVVSGYREFEYAQSALKYGVEDYLLKPVNKNELTELLHRIRAKLAQGAELEYQMKLNNRRNQELLIRKLRDCAEGGTEFPDMHQINEGSGFHFEQGISTVLLVKTDMEQALMHPHSYRMLMEHGVEILRKNLPMVADEWASAICPEGIITILNSGEEGFSELKRFFVRIRKEMEQEREVFGEIRVVLCLGRVCSSFRELPSSYRSAVGLCEDRLFHSEQILIADHGTPQEREHVQIGTVQRTALQEAAELLSPEAYQNAISDSYDRIREDSQFGGALLRSWFEDVIEITLFQLGAFSVDGKRVKNELLEQYWYCSTPEAVKALLEQRFIPLLKELLNEKESREAKPITDAKRYIREHYRETLRLEDVSTAVGFNATYLSTLFKKETGMNFMDYLTDLRMQKARELLCDGSLSLADVAEQVGYRDLKYFSRLFKKTAGINPSEYKKLYS
ncbi:MAG: response regulator [Lachnospiraceae bacterium]|nr:response regulator [Lachnospiraceae bacterium]